MAELVLAIIPLVISAIEHYSDVKKGAARYRRFSDDIDDFFMELDSHCGIFKASVQLLLTSAVGSEEAARMVHNLEDTLWKDDKLDVCVSERLGGLLSAAKSCLRLVHREGEKLSKVCNSYRFIALNVELDETLSLKKKARKIGKKIKAVLAAENTHEIMKSFGDRIERFRVMVEQTERLAEKDVLEEPSPSAKLTVREYGAVKSAAGHLYSAFGRACAKHTEHYGYIGLQPTHGRTDRVKFVLAFRSRNQQNVSETTTASKHDTVWLTIESEVQEITSRTQSNGILASLHTSAKRIRESEQTGTTNVPFQDKPLKKERKERPKNRVSFQADSSTRCPLSVPDITPATPPVTATDVLVNFCNQSNFCTKVKNLFNQPQHPVGRCIGYLEASGTSRHLVYIHSWMNKGAGNNENDKIMALSQVLVDTSQKRFSSGALTVQARLHMSKQLALALLQFHQTRWLRESWSSDDIMLSESQRNAMGLSNKPDDCKEELDAIQEPYANVSIREENATATQPAARQPSPIKNRALFNLGKILLELAFLAPFQKLKLPEEEGSQSTEDAENLIAADRLLCSVSAEMGLDFPEIVRKCIHCDFAQGHDLGSERLQAAFYQYVICGLARCEKKARSSPLLM